MNVVSPVIVFVNGLKMDMVIHPDFLKYEDICQLISINPNMKPTIMVEEVFDTDIKREYALTPAMKGIKLKGRNLKHLVLEIAIVAPRSHP